MLKNLLPPVLIISILAIFSNEHMLSLFALHRVEAKTKAIFAFHMLGVSWDDIANSPNSRVNTKEKSISPEIITAMLTKISYVAIRDAKVNLRGLVIFIY
jgi:hypothetical protein